MMSAPIQAQGANATAATGSTGSSNSSSSSGTSSTDLQSTFLNLLVTELQNQDPTSPVDPTEMVSQMVSLNQLDQLISINQTLANMSSGSAAASGSTQTSNGSTAKAPVAQQSISAVPAKSLTGGSVAFNQIPAQNTVAPTNPGLMNLYGGFGAPIANSILKQIGAR
jgi:flagellar basal-body rod modification protein FlgD